MRAYIRTIPLLLACSAAAFAQADLSVSKQGPSLVLSDSDGFYTITVTNNGPSGATGLTVTDALPAGMTFVSLTAAAGFSCASPAVGVNGSISCTAAALGPGATATFNLTAHFPASGDGTVFSNTATVTSGSADPNPGNNTSTSSATVGTPIADLAVTKTGPDTAPANTDVTYTITLQNIGPNGANGVTLSDPIPPGMTFSAVWPPTGYSCSTPPVGTNGTITCPIGVWPPGAMANFIVVLHLPLGGQGGTTYTNIASVTSSGSVDPNSENDSGVQATTIPTATADLSILKTGPDAAVPGANVSYTLSVTNAGPNAATSVVVTDTLPGTMTFVSTSGAPCTTPAVGSGGTITCTAPSVPAGGTLVITLVGNIPPATPLDTNFTNQATVSSSTFDPNSENDTASWGLNAGNADLAVSLGGPGSGTVGGTLTYNLTFTNSGPGVAINATLVDSLAPSTTFVSLVQNTGPAVSCATPPVGGSGTISCHFATLASGSSATFTVVASVLLSAAGQTIINTASVSSVTADPAPGNNSAAQLTSIPPLADLIITKSGPIGVAVGDNAVYVITVTNAGPNAAAGVTVTDALQATVGLMSAVSSKGSCAGVATVTCTIGALSAGGSASITLTVHVNDNSTITNTATVASATADPNPANNTSTVQTPTGASAIPAVSWQGLLLLMVALPFVGLWMRRLRAA